MHEDHLEDMSTRSTEKVDIQSQEGLVRAGVVVAGWWCSRHFRCHYSTIFLGSTLCTRPDPSDRAPARYGKWVIHTRGLSHSQVGVRSFLFLFSLLTCSRNHVFSIAVLVQGRLTYPRHKVCGISGWSLRIFASLQEVCVRCVL